MVELPIQDPIFSTIQNIDHDPTRWILFVNGSRNMYGSGLGIVLISLEGQFEHNNEHNHKISNNKVGYEALITKLQRALLLHAECFKVLSDSQLVVKQVIGGYATRKPNLVKYLGMVKELK